MPPNSATKQTDLQKLSIQNIDVDSMGDNLIMNEIHNIRSNLNFLGDNDSDSQARFQESYCHAFYRVLGLPIISKDKNDFYNPGWIGSNNDTTAYKERRDKIDKNQDTFLATLEMRREYESFQNSENFNNSAMKLKYRVDMLKAPIQVKMMDDSVDALAPDNSQIKNNYKNRSYFTNVSKILRPFKCMSFICNNIQPVSSKLYAPFVFEEKVLGKTLSRTYLEFVAKSRFSSDITKSSTQNEFKDSLTTQLQNLKNASITDVFYDNINNLSNIEAYIFSQMFSSFYSVCAKIKESREKNIELGMQLNTLLTEQDISVVNAKSEDIQLNTLELQINKQKSLLAEREMMLAFLPTGTQLVDGISLSNKIDCKLNNTFLQLTQTDIKQIKNNIQMLNEQKNKNLQKFNSINKKSFYLLGEVTGIGLIDIMALMMAFWLMPQDKFLYLLDNESFERMYKDSTLRNETVEKRHNKVKAPTIAEAITTLDKITLNLLQIASDIIGL